MKPDKIILLRHGQSEGNVDKSVYSHTPDYALQLSQNGHKQACVAGQQILSQIDDGTTVQYYVSPYWRTRQTFEHIRKALARTIALDYVYEDPRLREQEWSGDFRKDDRGDAPPYADLEERRDNYGHFYFRLHGGESCADVYDRMSDFIGTMHRDFEKPDFARTVIIVGHGMTLRVFLMRWFHWSVEEFERVANPLNCEWFLMERGKTGSKYELKTKLRHHEVGHKWQYEKRNALRKITDGPIVQA